MQQYARYPDITLQTCSVPVGEHRRTHTVDRTPPPPPPTHTHRMESRAGSSMGLTGRSHARMSMRWCNTWLHEWTDNAEGRVEQPDPIPLTSTWTLSGGYSPTPLHHPHTQPTNANINVHGLVSWPQPRTRYAVYNGACAGVELRVRQRYPGGSRSEWVTHQPCSARRTIGGPIATTDTFRSPTMVSGWHDIPSVGDAQSASGPSNGSASGAHTGGPHTCATTRTGPRSHSLTGDTYGTTHDTCPKRMVTGLTLTNPEQYAYKSRDGTHTQWLGIWADDGRCVINGRTSLAVLHVSGLRRLVDTWANCSSLWFTITDMSIIQKHGSSLYTRPCPPNAWDQSQTDADTGHTTSV